MLLCRILKNAVYFALTHNRPSLDKRMWYPNALRLYPLFFAPIFRPVSHDDVRKNLSGMTLSKQASR